MNKNTLIVLIVIILLVAGGFLYFNNKKTDTMMTAPSTQTQPLEQPKDAMMQQDEAMKPPGEKVEVKIKNFKYEPGELRIKKGTTVNWTNEDLIPHDVQSSDKSIQSPVLKQGETFSYTFNTVGTIDYICSIHPMMKGKVIVEE